MEDMLMPIRKVAKEGTYVYIVTPGLTTFSLSLDALALAMGRFDHPRALLRAPDETRGRANPIFSSFDLSSCSAKGLNAEPSAEAAGGSEKTEMFGLMDISRRTREDAECSSSSGDAKGFPSISGCCSEVSEIRRPRVG